MEFIQLIFYRQTPCQKGTIVRKSEKKHLLLYKSAESGGIKICRKKAGLKIARLFY